MLVIFLAATTVVTHLLKSNLGRKIIEGVAYSFRGYSPSWQEKHGDRSMRQMVTSRLQAGGREWTESKGRL